MSIGSFYGLHRTVTSAKNYIRHKESFQVWRDAVIEFQFISMWIRYNVTVSCSYLQLSRVFDISMCTLKRKWRQSYLETALMISRVFCFPAPAPSGMKWKILPWKSLLRIRTFGSKSFSFSFARGSTKFHRRGWNGRQTGKRSLYSQVREGVAFQKQCASVPETVSTAFFRQEYLLFSYKGSSNPSTLGSPLTRTNLACLQPSIFEISIRIVETNSTYWICRLERQWTCSLGFFVSGNSARFSIRSKRLSLSADATLSSFSRMLRFSETEFVQVW